MRARNTKWLYGGFILGALLSGAPLALHAQASANLMAVASAPGSAPVSAGRSTSSSGDASSGASAAQPRLRIGGGDLLDLAVFNVPEMTQTVRVNDLGDATFSLIGTLHLAQLTTDQARNLIAQKLQDGNFILHPQVSVLIREYATQGVSVLGEVNKPGVYQVLGDRTLLDVLTEAGGPTTIAGSVITVKRGADGAILTIPLTKNAQASLASDIQLQPGDKVLIPRASLIYVLGDVNRPGAFVMQNDGRMTATQALAYAGGNTRTAEIKRAILVHKTATTYSKSEVSLRDILRGKRADVELQADDILYLPNSAVKSVAFRGIPTVLQAASTAAIYASVP